MRERFSVGNIIRIPFDTVNGLRVLKVGVATIKNSQLSVFVHNTFPWGSKIKCSTIINYSIVESDETLIE